jgi:hypothetical protein
VSPCRGVDSALQQNCIQSSLVSDPTQPRPAIGRGFLLAPQDEATDPGLAMPEENLGRTEMPWYIYVLQFVSGLLLANGVPHFVQGISGQWFQSPFASPPAVGKSSPVLNVLWGFGNLAAGFAILWSFVPKGSDVVLEWVAVGLGMLVAAVMLARHFGRVRAEGP